MMTMLRSLDRTGVGSGRHDTAAGHHGVARGGALAHGGGGIRLNGPRKAILPRETRS